MRRDGMCRPEWPLHTKGCNELVTMMISDLASMKIRMSVPMGY